MKVPDIFLKYFIGMISLQIGVSMLTGMYTMLALLMLMINGAELQYKFSSDHFLLIGMILLIFITWLIAFLGAYTSSLDVIQFALMSWTIFLVAWITISFMTIVNNDTSYCVANKTRCAPSLWLYENGNNNDDNNEDQSPTDSDENPTTSIDESTPISDGDDTSTEASPDENSTPEEKPSESPSPVSGDTPAMMLKNTHNSKVTILVENTSPMTASNLITRVIKYNNIKRRRKSTTMINKDLIQTEGYDDVNEEELNELSPLKSCSAKKKEIKLQDDEQPTENPDDETTTEGDGGDSSNDSPSVDNTKYIITMSYYLALFLYSWYVLLSYFVELKCIQDCICHQYSPSIV